MDKETIIGIKHTCNNFVRGCNLSFIEGIVSDDKPAIKSNSYICPNCGYTLMKEMIQVSSHIIDEYAYQRFCEYEKEKTNVR